MSFTQWSLIIALHLLFGSGAQHAAASHAHATRYCYTHTHTHTHVWLRTHERSRVCSTGRNNVARTLSLFTLVSAGHSLLLCSGCAAARWEPHAHTHTHTHAHAHTHTAPWVGAAASCVNRVRSACLHERGNFFMNGWKLKMAVDARRKWLPREKVMPGKPGRRRRGRARRRGQSESSALRPEQARHPRASEGNDKRTVSRASNTAPDALMFEFTVKTHTEPDVYYYLPRDLHSLNTHQSESKTTDVPKIIN